jgi:arylsulfatase A-like enzyme
MFCCRLVVSLVPVTMAIGFAPAAERPNIVYFLVDDLGAADCGFAGGTEIKTPHVDKLAGEGCRLNSFYVQPLCSPTRAAFLTGRYPMRYGLQVGVVRPWADYGLPLEEKTLADDLSAAGYATGIFGKWHLGILSPEYLPTRRGFTKQYGHYNGAINYFTHDRDGGLDWHEDDNPLREEGYSTDLIGQHAAQFVRDNAGKKPFFLYVPFNAVHSPYQPPTSGVNEYPELKGQRQKYAAMLTATDKAIGEITAAVKETGVRDNTLFIFSSDNGGPAPGNTTDNSPLRAGKGTLYEGGVRVAAFVTWDGHVAPGTTNDEALHVVDLRPTLDKLCGAKPTGDLPLDGHDIWPTLTEGAPSPHEAILLNTTPQEGAVRVGDWKLVVRKQRRRAVVELYELSKDLGEKTNLAEANPETVAELQAILKKFADEAVPPKQTPQPADYEAPKVWGEFGG